MTEECVHDRCVHTCAECGVEVGTESHDTAYQNGYADALAEATEEAESKENFIERQAWLVESLMGVVTAAQAWHLVPDDVHEELRNYA